MTKQTTLPDHLTAYDPDFNARIRAVTMNEKIVVGTFTMLENVPAVKTDTGLYLIKPETVQPFVPAVGAFIGDYLYGYESNEYSGKLSQWQGLIVYNKNEHVAKVYDLDEQAEYDINDYKFDKIIPAVTKETENHGCKSMQDAMKKLMYEMHHPCKNEIRRNNEALEKMQQTMHIETNGTDVTATFDDIDLSFLDKRNTTRTNNNQGE